MKQLIYQLRCFSITVGRRWNQTSQAQAPNPLPGAAEKLHNTFKPSSQIRHADLENCACRCSVTGGIKDGGGRMFSPVNFRTSGKMPNYGRAGEVRSGRHNQLLALLSAENNLLLCVSPIPSSQTDMALLVTTRNRKKFAVVNPDVGTRHPKFIARIDYYLGLFDEPLVAVTG